MVICYRMLYKIDHVIKCYIFRPMLYNVIFPKQCYIMQYFFVQCNTMYSDFDMNILLWIK